MIKTIFFDLDGVLTTDKSGSFTVSKYFAEKLGVNVQEVFEYKKQFDEDTDTGKMSDFDVWEKTCKRFGVGDTFNEKYLQEAFESTPIDEKMVQYAKQLKSKYNVGIITDNSIARVDAISSKNNWSSIFDITIISEDVKSTKKGTKIFEIAVARVNAKPTECIFIDNKQANVDSAQNAGLIGVYFDDQKRDYKELFKQVDEIVVTGQQNSLHFGQQFSLVLG